VPASTEIDQAMRGDGNAEAEGAVREAASKRRALAHFNWIS
jgi:hypothetical protein